MSHNTTTENTSSNKIHHTHDTADSSHSHQSTSNNERDQQTIDGNKTTKHSHDVHMNENMQTDQSRSTNLPDDEQATYSSHPHVTKNISDNQTKSHDNGRMDIDSDDAQENQLGTRELVSHNEEHNATDSASNYHHSIKRASLTGDSTQNQQNLSPGIIVTGGSGSISDLGDIVPPVVPPHDDRERKRDQESESEPELELERKRERESDSDSDSEPATSIPDRSWLDLQFHDQDKRLIKKPNELEVNMGIPSGPIDKKILNRIQGSIIGMALGDALGAHVEFRPREYLMQKPVTQMEAGGTWGLSKGQFTDDTSMALCLANSLIASHGFNPYDQLVRYKWWYHHGYMSSTGVCFDIGAATKNSIQEFEDRQKKLAARFNISMEEIDYISDPEVLQHLNVHCSYDDVAGNGALMRLAPVPLFFYRHPAEAVEFSGYSGEITHGDRKAYDACRYYGALIVAALHGAKKDELLDKDFYVKHKDWFGQKELHPDIESIAKGSYQRGGYDEGIRGKGYIVNALEAALWAFWSDEGSFEKGALAAVNLGDDTDTTAAIYGQLAGACYGYDKLPSEWLGQVYAKVYMEKLSKWIAYEGKHWKKPCSTPISD